MNLNFRRWQIVVMWGMTEAQEKRFLSSMYVPFVAPRCMADVIFETEKGLKLTSSVSQHSVLETILFMSNFKPRKTSRWRTLTITTPTIAGLSSHFDFYRQHWMH